MRVCVFGGLDWRLGGRGFRPGTPKSFRPSLLPAPPAPSTPVIQVIDIRGQDQSVRCELWASDSALREPFPVAPSSPSLGAPGLLATLMDRLAALTIIMPIYVSGGELLSSPAFPGSTSTHRHRETSSRPQRGH